MNLKNNLLHFLVHNILSLFFKNILYSMYQCQAAVSAIIEYHINFLLPELVFGHFTLNSITTGLSATASQFQPSVVGQIFPLH